MEAVTNAALLVGSFLILRLGLEVEEVIEHFRPLFPRFQTFDDFTLEDCWVSIHHSKMLGWLDLDLPASALHPQANHDSTPVPSLDIDEYLHYDDPINGNFHFLIPDRLLLFHEPHPTSDGRAWEDVGGARRFSPDYYADLFGDFDVSVVVRAGGSPYSTSPFAARAIAVEDLALDPDRPHHLRSVDRFLSLLRSAPGPVALHGGPAGLGRAAPLVAACLMTLHAFPPAAAMAWLHLAHPSCARRRPEPAAEPAATAPPPLAPPSPPPPLQPPPSPAPQPAPGEAGPLPAAV
jgi:hypothetical protein